MTSTFITGAHQTPLGRSPMPGPEVCLVSQLWKAGKRGKKKKIQLFRHYLFNWDCTAASNAVCSALQDLLLFVWVTPFPRLQSEKKSLCSIKCTQRMLLFAFSFFWGNSKILWHVNIGSELNLHKYTTILKRNKFPTHHP